MYKENHYYLLLLEEGVEGQLWVNSLSLILIESLAGQER